MERVTNVFCGGSGSVAYMNLQSANNANTTPEKPSRSAAQTINNASAGNNKERLNNVTPSRGRIPRNRMKMAVPLASGGTGGYVPPATWEQLMQDDNFLGRFFLYFNATERRILAQVEKRGIRLQFYLASRYIEFVHIRRGTFFFFFFAVISVPASAFCMLRECNLTASVLSLHAGLHEMERHSVRKTASLDGLGSGGAMSRGSRYATELAHQALRLSGEKRLRLVGSPGRYRRRYTGTNSRFSAGTAICAFFVTAVLRGNGQRPWGSFGSFAGEFVMLCIYLCCFQDLKCLFLINTAIDEKCRNEKKYFLEINKIEICVKDE